VKRRDIPAAQALVTAHLLGTGDLIYRFLTERAQADAAQAQPAKPRAGRTRPARVPPRAP
jgi:hypothetical protein